mgnify:CR=1 FL=1
MIVLPTLHSGQADIYRKRGKLNAISCGRRFGKTILLNTLAADTAAKGRRFGFFAPEYKQLIEPFDALQEILQPIILKANRSDGRIITKTGGVVDFWTLKDNPLAGRGRQYHRIGIDEAAFTKNEQMPDIWRKSIKPTLLITKGDAFVASTPNGVDPDNFFYQIWHDPALGFTTHHAPTAANPFVPADELEAERVMAHPMVWKQEFLAEFISWDGEAFFQLQYFLDNGQPVDYPSKCDTVFAIMDCAVKSGTEHDATAIIYCSLSQYDTPHNLTWLDYEMHSIDAASLEHLAPKVLQRCNELAAQCNARFGSVGLLVEDAAGGQVLIQQAMARGWAIKGIDSKITARGKDERAMVAGGTAYAGKCKISKHAYDKTVEWKGRTLNHLLQQLTTFRIGDKEAYKRADDLLDCATYSMIVGCQDARAF